MRSFKAFPRESQETSQHASRQLGSRRYEHWPSRKAGYPKNRTYVRPVAARPPLPLRTTTAHPAAAMLEAGPPHHACWGCGETTHMRANCTSHAQVRLGCKRMGHREAVCWEVQHQLAPSWFIKKKSRCAGGIQTLPLARGGDHEPATSIRTAAEAAIQREEEMNDAEWSELECRDEEMGDADESNLVARDEDMDDVEGSHVLAVCHQHITTRYKALQVRCNRFAIAW